MWSILQQTMASIARFLVVMAFARANADVGSSGSQCAALETCYLGGDMSVPCTMSTGECPPCVLLADAACFVRNDGVCPFGVDCSSSFSTSSTSSSSNSSESITTDTSASTSTSAPSSPSKPSQDAGSSVDESVDDDSSSVNTVLIVAILAVAVVVVVLAVVLRKLFLRARASEEVQEEVPSPPGTVMTASFSSNGTSRDPGIMISRSAMGTDLSVTSKTSSAV